MLSGGIHAAGAAFTAYQTYQQGVSDRYVVVLTIAGGFVLSIFLQTISGKFSEEKKPLGTRVFRTIIKDYFIRVLFGVVFPFFVAYGYVKKNADTIAKNSFGLIQIDPTITLRGRDVTHLYPALVGVDLGFLIGQIVGGILADITKD